VRKEPRPTPADDQFEKIVAFIRNQRFTDHAEDSADLAEFFGAGRFGEAEAAQFHWRDFDLTKPTSALSGSKPPHGFQVPLYPRLRKFLMASTSGKEGPARKRKSLGLRRSSGRLKPLARNYSYRIFSPRALRRRAIVEQLRSGVNVKLVSKWQGHQDGGK